MIDVKVKFQDIQKIKTHIDKVNSYHREFVDRRTRRIANKIQRRAKQIIVEKQHIITRSLGRSISVVYARDAKGRWVAKVGTWLEYAGKVERLPVKSYEHKRRVGVDLVIDESGKTRRVSRYESFFAPGGGGYLKPALMEVMTEEKRVS